MAEYFTSSVGILQQTAASSHFPEFDRSGVTKHVNPSQEDYGALFAQLITRTAKDIDTLIDSLPSEESSMEIQMNSMRRLEKEDQEAARRLEEAVRRGEVLLEQLQTALSEIAQSQLQTLTVAERPTGTDTADSVMSEI